MNIMLDGVVDKRETAHPTTGATEGTGGVFSQ